MPVPEVWTELRNSRRTDTCLVVGNGPSLVQVSHDFLTKYDSFGSNRCYLKGGLIPDYYVAVNPLVIQQCHAEIATLPCRAKLIANACADLIPGSIPLHSYSLPRFSMRPWLGIYEGYTVTFVSLQLAYFMQYETVLLVGVDHRYHVQGAPNQEVVSQAMDPNHFNREYFGPGFRWNLPDLEMSEQAYVMAKNLMEVNGRRVLNVTPNSALEVFEKADWKGFQ